MFNGYEDSTTEHKRCSKCRNDFRPKYEWQTQCWVCFLASPKGKAWQARKDAENNGFNQGDNYWKQKQQESFKQDDDFDYYQSQQKRAHDGRYRTTLDDELPPLSKDLLRKLIMLCHPDKHGGSEMSNAVTKELLKMKERMK